MALPPRADMSDMSDPIQIFQDNFFNPATPMISHAPMPSVSKPPQRRIMQSGSFQNGNGNTPLGNSTGNIVINPPMQSIMRQSPSKMGTPLMSTSPLSPLKASQRSNLNAVSFNPPVDHTKPTDSLQKKQPLMSRFQTVAQKPATTDANSLVPTGPVMGSFAMGKENNYPIIFPAPPGLNLSIENYYQKTPGKRLLEPAPIKDGRPQKRARLDEEPIPPHDAFPPIIDDGLKPGHSYATLIGMAILRSAGRKLTLSQIYKWISDTYSFYNPQDAGWQNSIRHNLSLNKAFVKQERPKDDPGKGNYWAIESGMEHLFMKDKTVRKPMGDSLQVMSTTVMEPSLPQMPSSFQEPALPPQLPPMPMSMVEPSSTAPMANTHSTRQPELSSDATIIASDTAAPEEQQLPSAEEKNTPISTADAVDMSALESSQYSPIPATALHSSPPISRHIEAHSGTPPPVPRALLASSAQRSRKRKSVSMDDSGYISSLESSALRSNQNARQLHESGDRSRIKRGRAEEEIARLRASSYDSPTKNRSRNGYNPGSSSPLRHGHRNDSASSRMPPPPLTPAVKLKAPMRPPPSVSPGTNLRMHRDKVQNMLASPLRKMASASDDVPVWGSPSGFDESLYNFTDESEFTLDTNNLGNTFEIFQDDALPHLFPSVHNGSPIKAKAPSSKRSRLDRSYSVSALSDVTNAAARRNITSAPFLKVPNQSPGGLSVDTPSKFFDGLGSSPSKFFELQSPSKLPRNGSGTAAHSLAADNGLGDENSWPALDDICAPEFLQESDDFAGLDILQGFEKIGANIQPQQLVSAPLQPRLMPYPQHQQQQQAPSRSGKGAQKPTFGRSFTSTF
ncbi:forkhead transcription factor HCM1 [Sporothrix schenckii 1099-18]|nr:forkhead transcription factor HCM1 [Sporothrix schenckii 1099-18]KJR82297.1 forkhead transcription factor HCM1 [Sporothrix schenckii 1099-18]